MGSYLYIYIRIHIHTLPASQLASPLASQSVKQPVGQPASPLASRMPTHNVNECAPQPTHSGIRSHHTSTMRHSRLGQMLLNVDNDFMNAVRSSWHTISASFNQTGHACRMTSYGTNHLWMIGRRCLAVCDCVFIVECMSVYCCRSVMRNAPISRFNSLSISF